MISRGRRRALSCAPALSGGLLSFILLLLLLVSSSFAMDANTTASQSPALLVLLVDSLRWDAPQLYTTRSNKSLPGFTRLAAGGAFVDAIRPVFPAECFPNIFSLFSGRYPADHGAIFNDLYNETDNATYSFHNWTGYEKLPNLGIDKLFSSDLTKTKRVHLFNLPPACSHPAYAGVYCEENAPEGGIHAGSHTHRLRQSLDRALVGLLNGSADMAVVYFDELDQIGHRHGPLSDELLLHSLPELDRVINELISRLDGSQMPVNLLVTSDHGMTDVKSSEYLDRTISPSQVKKVINRGSSVSIWPLPDEHRTVYSRLVGRSPGIFTVYNRTSLPAAWRTGGPFFPPLLLVNRPGVFTLSKHWPFSTEPKPKGLHGYPADLADMHVPLFVYGPSVLPGGQLSAGPHRQPMDHLDTHALISHMLGLNLVSPSGGADSHRGVQLHRLLTPQVAVETSMLIETDFQLKYGEVMAFLIVAVLAVVLIVSVILTMIFVLIIRPHVSPSCSTSDLTEKLIGFDDTLSA